MNTSHVHIHGAGYYQTDFQKKKKKKDDELIVNFILADKKHKNIWNILVLLEIFTIRFCGLYCQ